MDAAHANVEGVVEMQQAILSAVALILVAAISASAGSVQAREFKAGTDFQLQGARSRPQNPKTFNPQPDPPSSKVLGGPDTKSLGGPDTKSLGGPDTKSRLPRRP
jgi:hypothetical protein